MGFLIDTNLWIAIQRGKLSPADIHAITRQLPVYLSPVNIGEIRFGLELMEDSRSKQRNFTILTANAKDFIDVPNLKFVVVKIP